MAKKPLAPQPASEEEQREEASHSEAESPSEEESEEESDNSSESEDDEDGEAFENVSVDFDFSEPQEGDYHGIKALLSSWAHDLQAEAPAIADLVLSQSERATVLTCGEERNVIGITALLPCSRMFKAVPGIRQTLLSRCKDDEIKTVFEKALEAPDCALLITERLINCPAEVAPVLQKIALDDAQNLEEDGAPPVRQVVFATLAFKESGAKKGSGKDKASRLFAQPEGECYFGKARGHFAFAALQADSAAEFKNERLAMLLSVQDLRKLQPTLEALVKC